MRKEHTDTVKEIKEILLGAQYAVFFGGAGVSTDSGIPDFRGTGGLYTGEGTNNEYFLSRECLNDEPNVFYDFYRKNMIFPDAKPNKTHKSLAKLEEMGIIKSVITQNIDGLHQEAGSNRVLELHGTVSRYYCTECGETYTKDCLDRSATVPLCNKCGGVVRPAVTLYGEYLDGITFAEAQNEVKQADVLIVGGSSLKVNPAAYLVHEFNGKHLIIINYSPTPYDDKAEYVIRDSLSEIFERLL